jgi:peptidoglycan hydrolase FlgJ
MGYGSSLGTQSLTSMQGLAADSQSLDALKMQAGSNSRSAIKETAKQFESLFMRELVKSMREATASMKSGMLDNPGSDLGTDLLDQQLAVSMSGLPGGLSTLIEQQLVRQMGVTDGAADGASLPALMSAPTLSRFPATVPSPPNFNHQPVNAQTPTVSDKTLPAVHIKRAPTEIQANFVSQHSDVASRVERATGIPASFMLGQAGHETGWGQHQIKGKGGTPSYNLFGIKAGSSWTGKVAEVTTTEYEDGVAKKVTAKFRAYNSYEDSFRDYARLISDSPRYAKARAQTNSAQAFASGLQKAGYATDPEYASKLSRAINTTLHLRRLQV